MEIPRSKVRTSLVLTMLYTINYLYMSLSLWCICGAYSTMVTPIKRNIFYNGQGWVHTLTEYHIPYGWCAM